MNDFFSEMVELYKKIEHGVASDSERMEFECKTKSCCIDYKVLMRSIKEAAKE